MSNNAATSYAPETGIRFTGFLGMALCLGLATGLVEAILVYVFQWFYWISPDADILGHSAELFWICPAVDMALFGLAGAVAGVAARLFRSWFVTEVTWFLLVALAVCNWLIVMLYGRIQVYALFILAAGISATSLSWVRGHKSAILAASRRLIPYALAIEALLAVAVQSGYWLQERIAEHQLPPSQPGAPNVLVVVVDTLRADHLHCYRYDRPTSPEIDKLAEKGTLFENCFSTASWTEPSHASMLTGRLTHEHNADLLPMNDRLPTIAEAMRERGYRTAAFSANYVYFSRRQRFGRGFLRFEDNFFSPLNSLTSTVFGHIIDHYLLRPYIADYAQWQKKSAEEVNDSYLRWLDANPKRPSFAILNYMELHEPYVLREPYKSQFAAEGNWVTNASSASDRPQESARAASVRRAEYVAHLRNVYDACAADADHRLGDLFQALQRRGLAKNTLVIVTADHGEAFMEHEVLSHGNSLYLEVLHVPLIIHWPGHVPENLRIGTPVSLANLAATVLKLVPGGDDSRFPQWPLSRLWLEPAIAAKWPPPVAELRRKPYYSARSPVHFGSLKALITPKWQLILNSGRPPELYDRQSDPQGLQNVADRPENASELRALTEQLDKLSPGWL